MEVVRERLLTRQSVQQLRIGLDKDQNLARALAPSRLVTCRPVARMREMSASYSEATLVRSEAGTLVEERRCFLEMC